MRFVADFTPQRLNWNGTMPTTLKNTWKMVLGAIACTLLAGSAQAIELSDDDLSDNWVTANTASSDMRILSLDDELDKGAVDDCLGCTAQGSFRDTCTCLGQGCGQCKGRLLRVFAPSDYCFDDFISPITNPIFFEDPRTLTEARFIFWQHRFPRNVGGGEAQLYGLQVRAALSDRLSVIASKNGFVVSDNPLANDGWADIMAGLKYNLFVNPQTQRLLSVGASYEIPLGSTQALQARGDGLFHLFLTGGAQLGERWHWLSGTGFYLPVDRTDNSSVWYWSNHLDFMVNRCWYVLGEVNWFHWLGAGDNGINGVEGLDLANLGSTGVAGNDIVTGALGVKYKPRNSLELGLAWETPLTEREDIIKDRLTFDVILRY